MAPGGSPTKDKKKKKFRMPSFSKKKEKEKKEKKWEVEPQLHCSYNQIVAVNQLHMHQPTVHQQTVTRHWFLGYTSISSWIC